MTHRESAIGGRSNRNESGAASVSASRSPSVAMASVRVTTIGNAPKCGAHTAIRRPGHASLYFFDPFGNHLEIETVGFEGPVSFGPPNHAALPYAWSREGEARREDNPNARGAVMDRKRRRRVIGALAIAVVLVASAVAAKTRPLWRSTARFVPLPAEPRVLYEPGAEEAAAVVAAALPAALAQVEAAQYRPFVAPVRVYVCASLDTFESYGSPRAAGGNLLHGRLFLSPKPENTKERLPRVLTHELSHLQIHQQLDAWQSATLPVWFNEGMGTLVSGGAGAEGVSDEEARRAIAEGRTFTPTGSEGPFSHATASHYGISAHLFYRQAALFLAYLETTEPARFRRFVLAIEDGAPLAAAFRGAYDRDVNDAWSAFVASVRDR